jgi:tetratricopeptide (TPR) repeat protein
VRSTKFVAYLNLGLVYSEQGQDDKATEVTSQALRVVPDNVAGYQNLGNDLLASQHFEDARTKSPS